MLQNINFVSQEKCAAFCFQQNTNIWQTNTRNSFWFHFGFHSKNAHKVLIHFQKSLQATKDLGGCLDSWTMQGTGFHGTRFKQGHLSASRPHCTVQFAHVAARSSTVEDTPKQCSGRVRVGLPQQRPWPCLTRPKCTCFSGRHSNLVVKNPVLAQWAKSNTASFCTLQSRDENLTPIQLLVTRWRLRLWWMALHGMEGCFSLQRGERSWDENPWRHVSNQGHWKKERNCTFVLCQTSAMIAASCSSSLHWLLPGCFSFGQHIITSTTTCYNPSQAHAPSKMLPLPKTTLILPRPVITRNHSCVSATHPSCCLHPYTPTALGLSPGPRSLSLPCPIHTPMSDSYCTDLCARRSRPSQEAAPSYKRGGTHCSVPFARATLVAYAMWLTPFTVLQCTVPAQTLPHHHHHHTQWTHLTHCAGLCPTLHWPVCATHSSQPGRCHAVSRISLRLCSDSYAATQQHVVLFKRRRLMVLIEEWFGANHLSPHLFFLQIISKNCCQNRHFPNKHIFFLFNSFRCKNESKAKCLWENWDAKIQKNKAVCSLERLDDMKLLSCVTVTCAKIHQKLKRRNVRIVRNGLIHTRSKIPQHRLIQFKLTHHKVCTVLPFPPLFTTIRTCLLLEERRHLLTFNCHRSSKENVRPCHFFDPAATDCWTYLCPPLLLGSVHTGHTCATQANGICWCEWECPHCSQAASKDLHSNLRVRVQCGRGLATQAFSPLLPDHYPLTDPCPTHTVSHFSWLILFFCAWNLSHKWGLTSEQNQRVGLPQTPSRFPRKYDFPGDASTQKTKYFWGWKWKEYWCFESSFDDKGHFFGMDARGASG